MMKFDTIMKFLLAIVFTQVAFSSSAQFSVGLNGGVIKQPVFSPFFGGEITSKYAFNESVRVGLNVGYYQNAPSTIYDLSAGTTEKFISKVIPVSVSGEYLFLKNAFRPYVGVNAGLLSVAAVYGSHRGSINYVCLAPVIGLEYRVAKNIGINANLKYNVAMRKNHFSTEVKTWKTFQPGIGAVYHF